MQYGDYIFRHNPAKIRVTDQNNIGEFFCPGKGSVTQNLGQTPRKIVCGGSFTGITPREALEQAVEFRRKTLSQRPGMLFLPGMEPFMAQLREFILDAEGDGRVLPYSITFVEQGAAI